MSKTRRQNESQESVEERANDLTNRYYRSVIQRSTTTADREADVAAVFARVSGLKLTSLNCPSCPNPLEITEGDLGYGLVDTTGNTIGEWYLGDRCSVHASCIPIEADILVQYRVATSSRHQKLLERDVQKVAWIIEESPDHSQYGESYISEQSSKNQSSSN